MELIPAWFLLRNQSLLNTLRLCAVMLLILRLYCYPGEACIAKLNECCLDRNYVRANWASSMAFSWYLWCKVFTNKKELARKAWPLKSAWILCANFSTRSIKKFSAEFSSVVSLTRLMFLKQVEHYFFDIWPCELRTFCREIMVCRWQNKHGRPDWTILLCPCFPFCSFFLTDECLLLVRESRWCKLRWVLWACSRSFPP